MELHQLFKATRLLVDKTQSEVASTAGIGYQSLQKFESGKASLSPKSLKAMAPSLFINPEFIDNQNSNPFKSEKLIKMFIQQDFFHDSLEPLYVISYFNEHIHFVRLIEPSMIRRNNLRCTAVPLMCAVSFMDNGGNMFLLRKKNPKEVANFTGEFPNTHEKILEAHKRNGCTYHLAEATLDRDLYDKIMCWTVTKRDIEPYFTDETKFKIVINPATDHHQEPLALVKSDRSATAERSQDLEDGVFAEQLKLQKAFHIGALVADELGLILQLRNQRISSGEVLKLIETKSVSA
ncbi:MAG: hypothetical protein CSYNP_02824 [Syntrophus sp. SKADARSKE-3]|nr:hypothetical protein [Syntrophus sp. SKADARSKE-3]